MAGTRGKPGLVVQPRDLKLLRELVTMRFVDREQAKVVAGFRSTTRANARLHALVLAGLLRRFFVGTIVGGRKAVYFLSPKGAALIGVTPHSRWFRPNGTVVSERFLDHQTRVNEAYLTVKFFPIPNARFESWTNFAGAISKTVPIIPDGYFELQGPTEILPMFVEVDLGTEPQRRWQKKVEAYLQLAISGEFRQRFHRNRFRVLVVANSARRLHRIRETVSRQTNKIFWFSTFNCLNPDAFWSPVWLRPRGEVKLSLI